MQNGAAMIEDKDDSTQVSPLSKEGVIETVRLRDVQLQKYRNVAGLLLGEIHKAINSMQSGDREIEKLQTLKKQLEGFSDNINTFLVEVKDAASLKDTP